MSIGKQIFLGMALFLGVAFSYACKPHVNWAPTLSFCTGNSIVLSAYNPNCTYVWNTGDTTSSITITTSGQYYVTVTNSCGSASDTIQVNVAQQLTPNLGPDRVMCASNLPFLSVPLSPNTTYLWQDASTGHQIPVTQSGMYHVKITNACGNFYDTVNITLEQKPIVALGPDINNCAGTVDTLRIPSGQTGQVYWSNGSTNTELIVSSPGSYWVQMVNGCGTFSDTIKVTHNQGASLNLGDTIKKCVNTNLVLDPAISGGTYLWSTNSNSKTITVGSPGTYWLRYTDNCGVFYDTVVVQDKLPPRVDLGRDTGICFDDIFYLDAGNPGSIYNWSGGANTQTLKVDTSGTYWVSVDNGCGMVYDTINVKVTYQPIDSIGDTAYFCGNGYVDVNAGAFGPSSYYYWDDGTTNQIHRYWSEGNHSVMVGNHCDTITVNFYVKRLHMPPLDIGNDTIVCGSLFLDTKLPPRAHSFLWSNGTKLPYMLVTAPGVYWVKVSNACGNFYDTVRVAVTYAPSIAPSGTVVLCQGSSVKLQANPIDTNTSYFWSTGDTTSTITVSAAGTYYLQAVNICGTLYDSVVVKNVFPINVDLGPDTSFCQSQVLLLDVTGYNPDSVHWSTGSGNGWLPVTQSGRYWVDVYNGCGKFSDSINISVGKPPLDVLDDVSYCIGGSIMVDATQSNVNSYRWSTGAQTPAITISAPGWYSVILSNDCGVVKDSFYVWEDKPINPFSIGKDTIFCAGHLWLDPVLIPGAKYTWQDGTNARRHRATVSGTYWVTISNSCNSYTDSIDILITGPPKLALGDSVMFCAGSIFTLNAQNPGCTYLWNDGSTNQHLSSDTAGIYWVTITNKCGVLTDTVELVTEYPLLNLELGNDTIICKGQTLTLDAYYDNVYTQWNTGESTRQITVNSTGLYTVLISNTCGVWTDTIFVEVQDIPLFSLGDDTTICNINGVLNLEGPLEMDEYQWSNGIQSRSSTFYTPGKKWLTVSNKCFSYTDTIMLVGEDPIVMNLGEDTALCHGESLLLSPGVTGYTVFWDNNLTRPTREITRTGKYWAYAKNSCGLFADTINVRFDYPLQPEKQDTVVCMGDSAVVDLSTANLDVRWMDGSTEMKRFFAEEGVYSVALTNLCGTYYKDFEVLLSNCDCPVHVANAFTPNGDGINEEYEIVYDCDLATYHLQIFNRWGEMIFESHNPLEKWDGTYNGKRAPIGTYNYLLNYSWLVYSTDKNQQKRGVISILR
jgi:gliding motility-associated-like protein